MLILLFATGVSVLTDSEVLAEYLAGEGAVALVIDGRSALTQSVWLVYAA